MDNKTKTELKNKIISTLSDLYIGGFHDPIHDVCKVYRDWLDSLDEYQQKVANSGFTCQYACDCERLDQTTAWNVAIHLGAGGNAEIELLTRNGGKPLVIKVRNDLAEAHKRIEIPSFFEVAGVGSRLVCSVSNHTLIDFVLGHFSYENGKYAKDLVDVKRLLEIDYTPLLETLAMALDDAMDFVNASADELRKEREDTYKALMKEFGMGQEKKPRYKRTLIKVVRV